jgi:diguanylate cyclase (GGDEF)-like protein/PAS domain S-box-containing protein
MDEDPLQTDGAQLAALLDGVGAFVFALDLQGRVSFANRAFLDFLGLDAPSALQGKRLSELPHCEMSLKAIEHNLRVLETGETVEGEESCHWLDSDRSCVLWTVKRPLHDAQGKVAGLVALATDISARKAVDQALQEQRELLHTVLNSLDAFVYMKDENRRYRYINDKVASNLGVRAEQVIGKLDREVLPPDWADQFWALDREVFRTGLAQRGEETHVAADGSVLHHWSVKVPVRYEGVPALIGVSTDISELVHLREQLRQQAFSDGLTGLVNHRHFHDLALKELSRARRHALDTALLLIDIDHFKRINDQFGHPCGDAVLQRVAQCLQHTVRQEDLLARVGGEEFAVLMPRSSLEAALLLGERLRRRVADEDPQLPDASRVQISVGVAVTAGAQERLETLYAQADRQLYRAKAQGRNRVCG